MGIETIIGLAALVISAIAGAFGLGHIRGTSKAEAKADQQRTEDNAAATVAAAERRVDATKEASNVQQTVNHMPGDDVDRELRDNWTRKGPGGETRHATGLNPSMVRITTGMYWTARQRKTSWLITKRGRLTATQRKINLS